MFNASSTSLNAFTTPLCLTPLTPPPTTPRYGDVTPHTTAEVVFTIVYVAFNIVVWAYVLGTITLLVTKQVCGQEGGVS
jgi:hypothetical protein